MCLYKTYHNEPVYYSIEREASMIDACVPNGPFVISIENTTDISSPHFPDNYPDKMNCTWRIVAANRKRIVLLIKGHELENQYKPLILR